MKRLSYCLFALAAASLLTAPATPQQLYKYIGPDGKVQYSDRPPADGRKADTVAGSRAGSVSSGAAPAAAGSDAAKAGAPKSLADQEQAFRKRRLDGEENARKAEKLAEEQRARSEACGAMRRELAAVQSGARVARNNEAGERVFLEDTGIQQEAARLQRDMAAAKC